MQKVGASFSLAHAISSVTGIERQDVQSPSHLADLVLFLPMHYQDAEFRARHQLFVAVDTDTNPIEPNGVLRPLACTHCRDTHATGVRIERIWMYESKAVRRAPSRHLKLLSEDSFRNLGSSAPSRYVIDSFSDLQSS